jgi:voltage-gated potassium channel
MTHSRKGARHRNGGEGTSLSWIDPGRLNLWGLRAAPLDNVPATVAETWWRWPVVLALVLTIPAFYLELLQESPPLARAGYLLAGVVLATAVIHIGLRSGQLLRHLGANLLDLILAGGLVLAALLPAGLDNNATLGLRLVVALITLLRMVWSLQHLFARGTLVHMLAVGALMLVLCGAGYWWLEPTTPTLVDGLWLAFVTAATVGYGDVFPTTTASKIFSVFVVLLGFGVLTIVTAAIATRWVETEERIIEREILRDMHRQMDALHADIDALRRELLLTREHAYLRRHGAEPTTEAEPPSSPPGG